MVVPIQLYIVYKYNNTSYDDVGICLFIYTERNPLLTVLYIPIHSQTMTEHNIHAHNI